MHEVGETKSRLMDTRINGKIENSNTFSCDAKDNSVEVILKK
jgi:hypothetical protein